MNELGKGRTVVFREQQLLDLLGNFWVGTKTGNWNGGGRHFGMFGCEGCDLWMDGKILR
jgi:hypothetical protein